MDLYVLTSFLKLVEKQNFSEAAEELNMTQPTLSQQLSKFENELGVKLIDRTTRSFEVTEAGQEVAKYAKSILNIDSEMREKIEKYRKLDNTLRIGMIPTMGKMNMTKSIFSFAEDNKSTIDMKIFEDFSASLYKSLLKKKYDVIIANKIERNEKESYLFDEYVLHSGRIVVVCGEGHKFSQYKSVSLEDCSNEPIVRIPTTSSVSIIVDKEFKKHKLKQKVICSCETTSNMISLVDENYGISFLSDKIAQSYATPKTRIIKLVPKIHADIIICTLRENNQITIIKDFINHMLSSTEQV